MRFRGRLAASEDVASEHHESAAKRFRELSVVFLLVVTLLEHGELTGDEGSLAEAREIFEDLRATPWLERVNAGAPSLPAYAPA
jgi:hypothetical protein